MDWIMALTGKDLSAYDGEKLNTIANDLAVLLVPNDEDVKRPLDIKQLQECTFMQVALFEKLLKADSTSPAYYINLCDVFDYGPNTTVGFAFRLAHQYAGQLADLHKAWENHMPGNVTDREKKAGISQFQQFGHWGTAYRLADKDATKMPYIWNLPYKEIFEMSLYRYTESMYNQNLANEQTANRPKNRHK